MLGRLRQIVGSGSSSGSSAPAAADASPLLGMLAGGREPVLPVTRARPGSSHRRTGSASSVGGQGGRRRKRHLLRIALYLAMAVLLAASIAACTAVAAVAYYTLSIVWESPAAVAAAAAEAQAAAATARAAATRGGQLAQLPANNESTAATGSSQYTVVVMSYKARVSLLILVINQLGNCPSVAEVLLVWNGDDPPLPYLFDCRAPVRIRQEPKNDLSNRMRPDPGISTEAVLLADDDVLMRCADVERAFARWQANQQALVGFFPRLISTGPPPQYLPEHVVFKEQRFNVLLTAGEFASRDLLEQYWSEQYAQGRELVGRLINCEDILLNFVVAAAIRKRQRQPRQPLGLEAGLSAAEAAGDAHGNNSAAGHVQQKEHHQQQKGKLGRQLPHVVWSQPSRRLDLSAFSGVGISKARAKHLATRRQCVAQFGEWYGRDLLQTERVEWELGGSAGGRLLSRPLCSLPFMGCVYL
ncbi:hypothetical protein CHLNCDRAFT_136508 [Chlorella variabilis]|uniref:Glycosyl transferase 64 domain-containing protein n=1 Tax=Chlorella variabilis TaxID=554065 RepID=E1ZKH4_CHLVA|nr:hypothetical protein CHLNCDRAFT_136508 [Chlorella variabilis]EFN53696.1 hypothetical protein CHLNCDRAFT_136508 [Chlorella variabilis]|eukprot:XP_005845798.1 hypothetical protein CHLNCDRAFT_136508 [Chlorella variabilis]